MRMVTDQTGGDHLGVRSKEQHGLMNGCRISTRRKLEAEIEKSRPTCRPMMMTLMRLWT